MTSLAAPITHTRTELIIKRAVSVATVQSILAMDMFPTAVLPRSVDSLGKNQEKSVPFMIGRIYERLFCTCRKHGGSTGYQPRCRSVCGRSQCQSRSCATDLWGGCRCAGADFGSGCEYAFVSERSDAKTATSWRWRVEFILFVGKSGRDLHRYSFRGGP